jgi:hypothetical protein
VEDDDMIGRSLAPETNDEWWVRDGSAGYAARWPRQLRLHAVDLGFAQRDGRGVVACARHGVDAAHRP